MPSVGAHVQKNFLSSQLQHKGEEEEELYNERFTIQNMGQYAKSWRH